MSDLRNAPPPFPRNADEMVVFVDFIHATYRLDFDAAAQDATALSTITFEADAPGLAAISIHQPVTWALLNDEPVELLAQDAPRNAASFRVLSRPVAPGTHTLTVKSVLCKEGPYGKPVTWTPDPPRLECIFNMSDIRRDNGYLEAFLPSNYNFDHFKISFSVTVRNTEVAHSLYSNGTVSSPAPGRWEVEYPDFFTTSCPWFHLVPSAEFDEETGTYRSRAGRTIPILAYTNKRKPAARPLGDFIDEARRILAELESDFGTYPHSSVIIFARGDWPFPMEYAGATATTFSALRHELNHSYFARSVIPANGDAGWIDEAIAIWWEHRDSPSVEKPESGVNMGRRSHYIRTTSDAVYHHAGRQFLAHLDYLLHDRGGLKRFLKHYARHKRHQSVTASEFQQLLEDFYGQPLQQLFEECVNFQPSMPRDSREVDA